MKLIIKVFHKLPNKNNNSNHNNNKLKIKIKNYKILSKFLSSSDKNKIY